MLQRALNAEVASIPEAARGNVSTAALRFQFWRDLITSSFEGEPSAPHPLAPALQELASLGTVDPAWLLRMVDAREEDMQPGTRPRAAMQDLEAFADDTQGALLTATLEATATHDAASETAVTYAGRALGLTTALRGFLFHCAAQEVYFTSDLLTKHGLAPQALFGLVAAMRPAAQGGNASADSPSLSPQQQATRTALTDAVFDVATVANAYVEDARGLAVPSACQSALTPLVPVHAWLKRLEAANFDIFDPAVHAPLPLLGLHRTLLWNTITGTV